MTDDRLTRRDRRAAAAGLTQLAEEIATAAAWLDRLGDDLTADRAARLLECASRDINATCWLLFDPENPVPDGWLQVTNGARRPSGCSPDVPRA